ncbi:hypothetical protein [Zavarzinia sp. CC-PAN008]
MAKGQQRGNRQAKKPKQKKEAAAVVAPALKASSTPLPAGKKKG